MRKFALFCAAAAIVAPAAVHAQEVTSSIHGIVTQDGAPIAGATVVATHVPSGTRSTTTTDAGGGFSLGGLRPGGPYTVTVNDDQARVTDINTVVAQTYELPIDIAAGGEAIVVTASRLPGARSVSQGPATVLSARDIQNVPSLNHDIRDLMRRDPFARLDDTPSGGRAVSFAGQNARFNRFSVDGVPITDNFGLNTDGLPSRRSPIPLDAIGQFQTKVAPYDVREGNFQGGAINIVLKSGTNDFHGNAYYTYSSDELSGTKTKPGPGVPDGKVVLPNFKIQNYGVELDGPIIKDKLFFMVSGERYRGGKPLREGPVDNNAGVEIPTLTQAQVDQISAIAQDRYGYDTGGVINNDGDKDDRVVAKLDANLSDAQRFSLTGTYAKDTIALLNNTNSTTGSPQLGLASDAYLLGNKLYTIVGQLNSDWSDTFSTEVRGFYKDYTRIQTPYLGLGFAQFRVCTAPTSDRTATGAAASAATSCPAGSSIVSFGPDISRQANSLKTSTWGVQTQGRLKAGDHDIRMIAEYQDTKVFNLFVQSVAGNYYFDSLADLQNGTAQSLSYTNAVPSLDPNDAAANFKYQLYTFGIQDNWQLNDKLTVSLGARYDLYGGDSRIALSPSFVAKFGFPNTKYISGLQLFQPRFGFNFRPTSTVSVRGGFGLFGGGTPDVYVSNSFSNTGVLTNGITFSQANNGTYSATGGVSGFTQAQFASILTNVDGTQIAAAANDYLLAASGTVATNTASRSTVNALDPDFKIPSQWRGTLSADWQPEFDNFLGHGWNIGADFFYSTVRDQVYFTDIRSVPIGDGPNALTPDGRRRYQPISGANNDTNQDILLTNTKKGRSFVLVGRVDKTFDFGLSTGLAFTYQDIKDQTPATSSTAGSNYSNGAFIDNNTVDYGTSNDEVKYSIRGNLTFDHAFFGDYKSTIALFGTSRIGHPFSWTLLDRSPSGMRSAVWGGSGGSGRFLAYIPTVNDPLVSYRTADEEAQFNAFIDSHGLGKYRGKIAPRNAFNSKWYTRIDLHLAQEVPVPMWNESRITLFADIENFTNFLNKKWGQIREYTFAYTNALAEVQCLTTPVPTGTAATGAQVATSTSQPCAQFRYLPPQQNTTTVAPSTDTIYSGQSLYAIRLGVRFSF